MAIAIPRYLAMTLTQGGADAFVQNSVATEIIPANGLAFHVLSIDWALTTDIIAQAADFNITWGLTRDTKTAIALPSDSDVMLYDRMDYLLTTSGASVLQQVRSYDFSAKGIYIVEPAVYGYLDTTGFGGALTGMFRIWYEEVKLSEIEILRILNNA